MPRSPAALTIEIAGRRWQVAEAGHDISIALGFDQTDQPSAFGAHAASSEPLVAGSFIGDVRRGGSCNCATYTLTTHCNGTHTECVGHITEERISVRDLAQRHLCPALLVSLEPTLAAATEETSDPPPQPGDRLVTRAALEAAAGAHDLRDYPALVLRTLPNEAAKRARNYATSGIAPYFSRQGMQWLVDRGVQTLIVDLPSVDRMDDGGKLTAHRVFWGVAPGVRSASEAARRDATVTELAFIDEAIADGPYLLNLQVAPFAADAAPSRPILLPLTPA